MTVHRMIGLTAVMAALAMLTAHAASARESGIQRTPDGARVLVSKDVQGQRYAITQNTDGTLTGNVFFSATGAAKFLFCTPAGSAANDF
jgi:hypothetical protein